jgi:hypothetical protein
MGDSRLPVMWLYGPAGVAKTTAAWGYFTELTRDGTSTGYVDIDQLGMCYAALLHQAANDATADAEALESAAVGDFRIATDGRPALDIAREILLRTGWPGR